MSEILNSYGGEALIVVFWVAVVTNVSTSVISYKTTRCHKSEHHNKHSVIFIGYLTIFFQLGVLGSVEFVGWYVNDEFGYIFIKFHVKCLSCHLGVTRPRVQMVETASRCGRLMRIWWICSRVQPKRDRAEVCGLGGELRTPHRKN